MQKLSVTCKCYVNKQAYLDNLQPIETKYFNKNVTNWANKNIEDYAFDYVKEQEFFIGAIEDSIEV